MPYSFATGDETGDTGFIFDGGSTKFFVITIVLTNEPQTIRSGLDQLRHALNLSQITEFKFHDTPHRFRMAFLREMRKYPFVVRSLYVDKRILPGAFRKMRNTAFYGFFAAELIDRLPVDELGNTTLVLDEFGPLKLTRRAVQEQLRHHGLWGGKPKLLKRIAFRRSQSEAMIQVADMCGGAIYRRLTTGDDTYYRLIKNKTLVWEYRPTINPPT